MADSIGTVTVDVVPRVDEELWAEAFRKDLGMLWSALDEPHTVRLDDDSIDRLATAIADKLDAKGAAAIDAATNALRYG